MNLDNCREGELTEVKKVFYDCMGHDGYISSIKFIDHRYFISSSGDATICLWDIENPSY